MSLLIVGCGYLGLQAAALARRRGERVLGTVRSAESARRLEAAGVEPILLDVLGKSGGAPLPVAEKLLYCVGFDRQAGASMRQVYVAGLSRVLDRLPAVPSRMVYAGSTGVYGQADGSWVDEQTAPQPVTASGLVCLEAEVLVRTRVPEARILRFAGLYGPGRLPRQGMVQRGEPIPSQPAHWLNLVHIEDAARFALECLDQATPRLLYNVACDEPVLRSAFYDRMAALLGSPPPRFAPGAASARDQTNKRISARAIKADLAQACLYPTAEDGLNAILKDQAAG